ncbi:MAG: hypothetical protein LLG00_10080 [Planctomycetaceae bacterium]|nr:hypothetical protein [Planctomycetaceae bacterium]
MRFRIFPPERITEDLVRQAYLAGMERTAWPIRAAIVGHDLLLQRSVSESANVHVPWPVEGHGRPTLSSGSLIERHEPYLLPLELARGTLVQLRNQLADWQLLGLSVSDAILAKLKTATEHLSWAAVNQEDAALCTCRSEESLRAALDAAVLLSASFSEQALAVRRNGGRPIGLLGADLGSTLLDTPTARLFLHTFNAAQVPICWRSTETTEGRYNWPVNDSQIQWCQKHMLKVLAGPLLMLDAASLPDWLYLFEDDFDSVLDFVSALIRTTVERYRGKVDAWVCAGRVNTGAVLSLNEQQRLRLVARTVELTRDLDPDTPVLVSFDQPWAEYMRDRDSDFPPLHFADTLLRAGLEISGLMLEMNVGYFPGGTLTRHVLEFNRQLDTWSLFGLPLWISLCAPSAANDDPRAQRKGILPPTGWTAASQHAFVARFVPLALAKPIVQGVLWNQLRDNQPHDFPHGGLFDLRSKPKPALSTLATIRKLYLKK